MSVSKKPAPMSGRTVGRVLDALGHVEGHDAGRYNGGVPPGWRDQRGDRHVFPIRVTGSPDGGTPNLWPAKVRYWSGYAAGTHSFADADAFTACWAFPAPGGDGLANTGEYLALFVGVHSDGKAVYEAVSGGGSPPAGCPTGPCGEPPPLPPLACLRFASRTGWATCLPGSLPLVLDRGTDGCGRRYVAEGGELMFDVCDGGPVAVAVCGRSTALAVALVCDGTDWRLRYTGSDAAGVAGGRPLDGTHTSDPVTAASFAAAAGSVSLGTLAVGGSSSVALSLAWGTDCLDCGCDGPPSLPADACLLVDQRTGTAACAPSLIDLELSGGRYVPAGGSATSTVDCGAAGNVATTTVCGQETLVGVTVACDPAGGYTVRYAGIGYAGTPTGGGNPLAGTLTATAPCETFDGSGVVVLGTVTTSGGSARLRLAWGADCGDQPPDLCPPAECRLGVSVEFTGGTTALPTLQPLGYDSGTQVTTWEGSGNSLCGTGRWVAVCDEMGGLSLLGYDGTDMVFAATFAPSGSGTWTGTISQTCGDITAVTLTAICGPGPGGGQEEIAPK